MGRIIAAWLGVLCLSAASTPAQYRFDHWTTDNGLPHNWIKGLRQTRDGYLWLTTADGLARFDGVRFRVFRKGITPGLTSNAFFYNALFEDRQGNLWMGTEDGGVIRYRDGVFTAYTTNEGLPNNKVIRIDEDAAGTVWFFTKEGLAEWRAGRLGRVAPVPGSPFNDCLIAPKNLGVDAVLFGLWRRDSTGWQRFAYGQWTPLPLPPHLTDPAQLQVDSILEDARGNLWYDLKGRDDKYYRVANGHLTVLGGPFPFRDGHICYEDRAGRVWAGSHEGENGFWQAGRYTRLAELTTPHVFRMIEDREGNLWLATLKQGLYRFREQVITMHRHPGGPEFNEIGPILQDRAGQVWLRAGGFAAWQDGHFENYYRPGHTRQPWEWGNYVTTLYEDQDGSIWVGSWDGIARFYQGQLHEEKALSARIPQRVNTMQRDRHGVLWFGGEKGLYSLHDDQVRQYSARDGLVPADVRALLEDRQGRLWVATEEGLARATGSGFRMLTSADGLSSNIITALYEDSAGVLWIGTHDGGLNRLEDGPQGLRITRYTTEQGLFSNRIFHILEDDHGFLWLSCHLGLFRVRKQELNDFAAGRTVSITCTHFGQADGLSHTDGSSYVQPAGYKMRDGKLWFPMLGGIAVVDPAAVPFNPAPPPVVIEECLLDRQPVAFQSGLQIRPGAQNLEINYTGLSLIKSEQLRFRYRLEGLDHDWVEAGTRRTAYYPHLPPGSYTFEVRAANSDGIWNTEGQRLRITVLPPFYRTWWFLTLATLLVGGVVFGVYKYRVTQLERRQAAQQAFARQLIESQESERKRIAAELHDSLGQSLVLIRNWALLGTSQLDKQAPAKEELDEITTTAARALNEVREIAYNLGPYHLDRLGLAGTIEDMVNRVAQASQIEFTTELTLPSGLLTREAEMHLYRITQEALNNLVKHSAAAAARVALQHDAHEVKLIVRDNGRGFDPHTSANHGKRGGFGLHGIEERVQLLGGVWTMQSAPGQGTTIEVTIGVKTV